MPKEAITKDSVAYYACAGVIEAVLCNLGCRRDKPAAWLDLTMHASIRMFALMHLRYDLIVPGRNQTATVITMRPRNAERLETGGVVYRVELVPMPAPDEGEKHLIALQALLDESLALNRHWCAEVEMIRAYHVEAPGHSVHCLNDAFSPAEHLTLGDVARELARHEPPDHGTVTASMQFNPDTREFEAVIEDKPPPKEMDPETLEFDLVPDPPKEPEAVVEMTAEEPPVDAHGRRKAITLFPLEACPRLSFENAEKPRDLEKQVVPIDEYLIIRF